MKNIKNMTKAELIEVINNLNTTIEQQTNRLSTAEIVYHGLQKQVKALTVNLAESDRINKKMEHEINSLKAYQYKKHNTPAPVTKGYDNSNTAYTETAAQSNKNIHDSQTTDPNQVSYANGSKPTIAQMKVLCDLWSKFEGIQLPKDPMLKEDVRLEIDRLLKAMHNRELVFRKIKYNPEQVLERYVDKYSALIQNAETIPDDGYHVD